MVVERYKVLIGIVGLLSALCVYFYFDPSDTFFPRCPFLTVTGFQCPGCGSQRAIHALLHGDVVSAWHYNAMLLIFIPFIILLLIAETCRIGNPRFYRAVNNSYTIWISAIILVAWGIFRNF